MKKILPQNSFLLILIIINYTLLTENICNAKGYNFKSYFATLKFSEVNARVGPNKRYPITWQYIKINEPIEVIAKFDNWRKIRDYSGDESWIHVSMISSRRFIIIIGNDNIPLFKNPRTNSKIVAYIQPGVRSKFNYCKQEMCNIVAENYKGWIDKKNIWGINKYDFS